MRTPAPGRGAIVILGVFVADASYRAPRMPRIGETLLGEDFVLGPGGKGSNQSVAAARAGADVHFITRLGDDAFAGMARDLWTGAGITPHVLVDADSYTGSAFIFVEAGTGDNAIIISPGAGARIGAEDISANRDLIAGASVFMTQLEQPQYAALAALGTARRGGAVTVLNPAPAAALSDEIIAQCDYITPNETEAEGLTGIAVHDIADARRAADALIARGAGAAIITLGERGALLHGGGQSLHLPALNAGSVVETTGAGDAFNGGFVAALARGLDPVAAARFGAATAAISVTRPGTAPSMPVLAEIEALLRRD